MGEHALLSASASHRWLNCTPSARLEENIEDKTSEFAEEGTLAHEIGELNNDWTFRKTIQTKRTFTTRLNKLKKHELYKDEMMECVNAYTQYVCEKYNEIKVNDRFAEINFEERLDFSQYVPDGFGTGDTIIVGDKKIIVIDYKHGKGVRVSAEDNTQMMLYGLGAYLHYGIVYDIETVEMVIFQPRIDNISSSSITISDLMDWADGELKQKAELAFDGAGEFVPGRHCRFCKIKATCRALAEDNLKLQKYEYKKGDMLSNDEIADIVKISERLINWTKDIKAYALNRALDGESFSGFKVVEGTSRRAYTDEEQIEKALTDNGYNKEDFTETNLLTIGKMEKLLTKKGFKEILSDYVIKPTGKPTLVFEDDPRPMYNTAVLDFENVNVEEMKGN